MNHFAAKMAGQNVFGAHTRTERGLENLEQLVHKLFHIHLLSQRHVLSRNISGGTKS
jgi:hypothetical protein